MVSHDPVSNVVIGREPMPDRAPKAFMDMTQEQGALSPDQTKDLMDKTYQQYANVSPQELEDAYKFVNGGPFDHGQQKNFDDAAAPPNPAAPPNHVQAAFGNAPTEEQIQSDFPQAQTGQRSDLFPHPNTEFPSSNYLPDPFAAYDDPGIKSYVDPAIDQLNPNEIENNINIGAQSSSSLYSGEYNPDYITDLTSTIYPEEDGAKKSGVPKNLQHSHIPPNATHPRKFVYIDLKRE